MQSGQEIIELSIIEDNAWNECNSMQYPQSDAAIQKATVIASRKAAWQSRGFSSSLIPALLDCHGTSCLAVTGVSLRGGKADVAIQKVFVELEAALLDCRGPSCLAVTDVSLRKAFSCERSAADSDAAIQRFSLYDA